MAFDYSSLAATATRLIEKFGRSVTLTKKGSTSTTAGKPWQGGTAVDSTSTSIKAVADQTASATLADAFREDTRVKSSDTLIIIDGAVEPEEGDKLVDGTQTYEIVSTRSLKPGDTALAYFVAMRA